MITKTRRPDALDWWGEHCLATIYGVCAVTFMMVVYALKLRGRNFVLLFAFGCLLSSAYGFISGTWPFGVVECIWSGIAETLARRPLNRMTPMVSR